MAEFGRDAIRRYYDRHTSAFLAFGQGGRAGSIHRAVWGPGTTTRLAAFHFVDDQIADLVRSLTAQRPAPLHVVDLGCGVGASLVYLAERLPILGTGITLSPVQARVATERIRETGLSERVRCCEGDYTALPADVAPADLAYAIESFVHGPDPDRFFAECARLVRPQGLLVVCDDIRRPSADAAADRACDRFRRGWHVNTLLDRDTLQRLARAHGFEHVSVTDLSPWLELARVRDRLLAVPSRLLEGLGLGLEPFFGPRVRDRINERWGPLIGGHALQTCVARGWIGYDFAVFRRIES